MLNQHKLSLFLTSLSEILIHLPSIIESEVEDDLGEQSEPEVGSSSESEPETDEENNNRVGGVDQRLAGNEDNIIHHHGGDYPVCAPTYLYVRYMYYHSTKAFIMVEAIKGCFYYYTYIDIIYNHLFY